MPGRLGIDFGTSNTRAAVWDEASGQAVPLVIPDVSLFARYQGPDGTVKVEVRGVKAQSALP